MDLFETKKKKKRSPHYRFLAARRGEGAYVMHAFSHLGSDEMSNCGNNVKDMMGELPPEDGVWTWSGKIRYSFDYYSHESDIYYDGIWRKPTEHELKWKDSDEDMDAYLEDLTE